MPETLAERVDAAVAAVLVDRRAEVERFVAARELGAGHRVALHRF